MRISKACFLILACGLAAAKVSAQDLRPSGWLIEAGTGGAATRNATVGAVWKWRWHPAWLGTELDGVTEAYISEWNSLTPTGRRNFTQVGVVPLLRLPAAAAGSRWYAEAGIGLSMTDPLFTTVDKQFSTRFNFIDIVGAGVKLGAYRSHEVGLRISHSSNGGIRKPNPGQNFLQLRYASAF